MTNPQNGQDEDVLSTQLVHLPPNPKPAIRPVDFQRLAEVGGELIEQFLRRVATAILGVFFPNIPAFEQLAKWGIDLVTDAGRVIGNIGNAVMDGINTVGDFLSGLWNAFTGNNQSGKKIGEVTAAAGGLASTANTANANAATAQSTASAANSTANTAKGLANTAISNPANLASDPGWENTSLALPGTVSTSMQYSTERPRTGSRSLKIVQNGSAYSRPRLFRTDAGEVFIPTSGSDVYYCEVWVYGNPGNADTVQGIWLEATTYNLAGNSLGGVIAQNSSVTAGVARNGVWTKVAGYLTVPAAAVRATVYVTFSNGIPNGNTYYVDDAVVYRFTDSQSLIDYVYQGALGGTSTGNAMSTVKTGVSTVASTANTAKANAATADGKAVIAQDAADAADGKAVNAQDAADAADGKAVAAKDTADNAQSVTSESIASGSNLVPNPSFENTAFFGSAAFTTAVKRTGSRSLQIAGAGTGTPFDFPLITNSDGALTLAAAPLDIYYVEFWVYGKSTNAGGGTVSARFVPQTAAGANLTAQSVSLSVTTTHRSVWTKVSGTVTMPENTAKVSVVLRAAVTSGDVYYFDDVFCRELTAAAAAKAAALTAQDAATGAQSAANNAQDAADAADGKAVAAKDTADNAQSVTSESIASGSNLVPNPSFENTAFFGSAAFTTAQKRTGSRSLQLTGTGTGNNIDYSVINDAVNGTLLLTSAPGDKFSVEFWVSAKSGNTAGGTVAMVFQPQSSNGSALAEQSVSISAPTSTTWVKVSGTVVMPADTACVGVVLRSATPTSAVHYFDDVILREMTAALDVKDSAETQIAANAAEIAALKALTTGNSNSGNSAVDNFELVTTSGLDPARWSWASSGTGTVRSDGVKAYWVDSGGVAGTWLGRYTATATVTSYQVISTVLNSPLAEAPILGGAQCWNYIFGRSNSTMSSFVYLKIGYNSLSIWKVVNGAPDIQVGQSVTYQPRVGDSIQLVLGTGDSVYQFQIKVNNQTVYTVTDSTYYGGVLSVENAATHNFGGIAFAASPRLGGGQSTPGAFGIFAIADNWPAPVIGSGMRAYRASTTPADLSSGTNIFPLGWFGQTQDKTPDLTYSSETGRVTVSVEGWYQVVIQQHGDSAVAVGTARRVRAVLFKGVGVGSGDHPQGQAVMQGFNTPWNNYTGFHGISGTFLIYLRPNEWIEPGYWSDGTGGDFLKSDSAGKLTWFSIALVNRSYA